MDALSRRLLARLLVAAMVIVLAGISPVRAVGGTTYYVSTTACSDTNPGTSATAPWCTFANANAMTFQSGDHLLLARGSTWDQELDLAGSGTAASPIVLDAYGTGARPRILRDFSATQIGVRMANTDYWTVGDLEVGQAGAGILANYTTIDHHGITLHDIMVHDVYGIWWGRQSPGQANPATPDGIAYSAGILFLANATYDSSQGQFILSGITLSNVESTHNAASLAFQDSMNGQQLGCNDSAGNSLGISTPPSTCWTNATLRDLYFHDDNAAGVEGMSACGLGVQLAKVNNLTLMDSLLDRENGCFTDSGTAAIEFSFATSTTVVNSSITNTAMTDSNDQTGIDFEQDVHATNVRNDYIAGNPGAGVEYLAIHPGDTMTGNDNSGNVYVGNGWSPGPGDPSASGAVRSYLALDQPGSPGGTIAGNLYAEPTGFLNAANAGNFNNFTNTDNVDAGAATNIANAGNDFSGTQSPAAGAPWGYLQSTDGATWTALGAYNAADVTHPMWQPTASATSSFVGRFDQEPAVGAWAARSFTASAAGAATLRGRVLRADPTCDGGAMARITQNGVTIFGPQAISAATDPTNAGVAANLDNLAVAAGDVLRFETQQTGNAACPISWDPSIASGNRVSNGGFESGLAGWSCGSGGTCALSSGGAPQGSQYATITSTSGDGLATQTLCSGTCPVGQTFTVGAYGKEGVPLPVAIQTSYVGLRNQGSWTCYVSFSDAQNWVGASRHDCTVPAGTTQLQAVVDAPAGTTLLADAVTVSRTAPNLVFNAGFEQTVESSLVRNGNFDGGTNRWNVLAGTLGTAAPAPGSTLSLSVQSGSAAATGYQDLCGANEQPVAQCSSSQGSWPTSWSWQSNGTTVFSVGAWGRVDAAGQSGSIGLADDTGWSCVVTFSSVSWTFQRRDDCVVPNDNHAVVRAVVDGPAVAGGRTYADSVTVTRRVPSLLAQLPVPQPAGWTLMSGTLATTASAPAGRPLAVSLTTAGAVSGEVAQPLAGWMAGSTYTISADGAVGTAGQSGQIGIATPDGSWTCLLTVTSTAWTYQTATCSIPTGTAALDAVVIAPPGSGSEVAATAVSVVAP